MAEDLLARGISAAREGRKEEAFRLLMRASEADAQNERAWLWLSQVVDSLDDKVVCLQNVLAIDPNNESARAGLAWLEQQGVAVAMSEPTPAPESAPAPEPDAEPCPRCGHPVPLAQNECAQCGLPMVVACPRCRYHVDVQQQACPECQLPMGDFRAGAAYHLALAGSYIEHGKADLVPGTLARAHNQAAQDPEVLVRIAELFVDLGDPASALQAIEEASAVSANDARLLARIGTLYQRIGCPDQARAVFASSARLGSDPVALVELARMGLADEHAEEARELLKEVTKADPSNAEAYLLLGDAERQLGKQSEAVRHYKYASQLTSRESPIGRQVFSRLVEIEGIVGAEARADWERQQRDGRYTADGRVGERPGCVTVYVVLMVLPTLLGLCALAFVATTGSRVLQDPAFASRLELDVAALGEMLPIWVTLSVLTSGLQLAVAAGLWFMKNWARVILLVFQIIGFIGQVITTGTALLTVSGQSLQGTLSIEMISVLISFGVLGLEAYIIFWFVTNRWRFS